MEETILMKISEAIYNGDYHYAVHTIRLSNSIGIGQERHAIVVKDKNGLIVQYTGLSCFAQVYTGFKPIKTEPHRKNLIWICHALNYLLRNYRLWYLPQKKYGG